RDADTYTVQLTVLDQFGTPATLEKAITVITPVGNLAPMAIIATGPRAAGVGSTLTFDGRLSFDPNGDEMTFLWTFTLDGVIVDTMTDSVVTKLFDVAGTYTVVLEVKDDSGLAGVTDPEIVIITAGGLIFEPPPSDPLPGGSSGEPVDSALQRPAGRICGFGMILSLFGSLAGLWSMGIARRRVRG
ncbi:MAG: PKD domain-containing protein, partial [Planctomycetes bacterium]|nr:PKD domain-containing protein [Planctomycetota bacterium]